MEARGSQLSTTSPIVFFPGQKTQGDIYAQRIWLAT